MDLLPFTAARHHFQGLKGPRVERARKHPLIKIVFIAVRGADSFAAIAEFGWDRRPWFARRLDLGGGAPSDDAFARVLARLDPAAFEKRLLGRRRPQAVQEQSANRLIVIDGKTLRGSCDRRDGKAAIRSRSGPMRGGVRAWRAASTSSVGPCRRRRSPVRSEAVASFREGARRDRTDHAPANLSVIRRFALGMLKREAECRRGTEAKRLKCAASGEHREKALFYMANGEQDAAALEAVPL